MSDPMLLPAMPLGVDLMDHDHAQLEALLAKAASVGDADLPDFLARVRTEIAAHFDREEQLMRSADVPVLACHVAQHSRLIEELDKVAGNASAIPAAALRVFLERDVPNLLMSHIASVDQISARFLLGDLDLGMVSRLRLPDGAGA